MPIPSTVEYTCGGIFMDEELAIVFAPELGISVEGFAEEWNATPDAPGEAQAIYPESVGFNIPPELIQAGMVSLGVIGGVISTTLVKPTTEAIAEFVKARVKAWLAQTFPEQADKVKVSTVRQANGAVLFVVHGEE
jgi:hypothetical protein